MLKFSSDKIQCIRFGLKPSGDLSISKFSFAFNHEYSHYKVNS